MNCKSILIAAALGLAIAGSATAAEPGQAGLAAQAKITRSAAGKIALAKVPSGTIKSAELEHEHGALVWSFDIASPGTADIHEILVNAKTGKIVYTEIETPKAQAKEASAEKAEAKKH